MVKNYLRGMSRKGRHKVKNQWIKSERRLNTRESDVHEITLLIQKEWTNIKLEGKYLKKEQEEGEDWECHVWKELMRFSVTDKWVIKK